MDRRVYLFQAVVEELGPLALEFIELETLLGDHAFVLELLLLRVSLLPFLIEKRLQLSEVFFIIGEDNFLNLSHDIGAGVLLHFLQKHQVQEGFWILLLHHIVLGC